MSEYQNISKHLNEAMSLVDSISDKNHRLCEKSHSQIKVLAKVKIDLERCLKNPNLMLDTIFNCIDACRELTPYFSVDSQSTKIDPPLTQDEKDAYKNKFEEYKEKK